MLEESNVKTRPQRAWKAVLGGVVVWLIDAGMQIGGVTNYKIARATFVLAGLLSLVGAFFLIRTATGRLHKSGFVGVVGLLVFATCLSWIYLAPVPAPEPDRGHIQPELVIDSVSNGEIKTYHAQIENIGSNSIVNVGAIFIIGPKFDARNRVVLPVTATLPPRGGKVSLAGVRPELLSTTKLVRVIFQFSAEAHGMTETFISSHRFILPANVISGSVIEPETYYELSGQIKDALGNIMNEDMSFSLAQAFTKFQDGTIFMVLPEKRPNGSNNYLVFLTTRLTLFYDPRSGHVTVSNIITGRKVTTEFNSRPMHVLTIEWKNDNPTSIRVDRDIDKKK